MRCQSVVSQPAIEYSGSHGNREGSQNLARRHGLAGRMPSMRSATPVLHWAGALLFGFALVFAALAQEPKDRAATESGARPAFGGQDPAHLAQPRPSVRLEIDIPLSAARLPDPN